MRSGERGFREKIIPLKEVVRRSLTDDLPTREDYHVIGNAQDVLHAVGDEDDADTALTVEHREHGEQFLASAWIKSCCRLVEHEITRRKRKHTCNGNASALPAREGKWRALAIAVGQTDKLHRLPHTTFDIGV